MFFCNFAPSIGTFIYNNLNFKHHKMRTICTLIAAAACCLLPGRASAQDSFVAYGAKVYEGVASAAHGYVETLDGQPGASGIRIPGEERGSDGLPQNVRQLTNWTNRNACAVYFFHHPKARVSTVMRLTIRKGQKVKFGITVTDPDNPSRQLVGDTLELTGTGAAMDTTICERVWPSAKYYRYRLQCLEGNANITNIDQFMFRSRTKNPGYVANFLSSPSVHLSNWRPTEAGVPTGNIFDFAYMEVMIPKTSDFVGTYAMSLGVLSGYMGIQHDGWDSNGTPIHDIIFSMWDKGSVDDDPNLPEYLRAGTVDSNPEATLYRFSGEGTGAGCRLNGYRWYPDTFVQFICNARPEKTSYWTIENGDSVEHPQSNILVSAWFNAQDGKGWQYLATTRIRNTEDLIGGWYSFLENYNWPTGEANRKAYYRNGFAHEYSTGQWYNFNQIGFGHTDGGTNTGARTDYGQGGTDDFPRTFYMQSGGYVSHSEGPTSVPYATDFTPVDTIQLQPLLDRVQQGVDKERQQKDEEEAFSRSTYDKTGWKVIYKSSEETSGEGTNGRAQQTVDGDTKTYWHSQWLSSTAQLPHTITVDMQRELPVGAYQITQSKSGGQTRYIKAYKMYGSKDNQTWTLLHSDDDTPDQASFRVWLDSVSTIRYFKIVVSQTRATDGPFVRINEMDMASASQTTGIARVQARPDAAEAQMFCAGGKVVVVADAALGRRATLQAYTADGRVVARADMSPDGDALTADMPQLAPGLYLLVANLDGATVCRKVAVR